MLRSAWFMMCVLSVLIISGGCGGNSNPVSSDNLSVDYEVTGVSFKDVADGAIDLIISGGKPPYAVEWTHGPTVEDLDSLTAGRYVVSVEDSKGSTVGATIDVPGSVFGHVTDFEGNVYKTIEIGDQCWMAENLKSTKDAQGIDIEWVAMNNDAAKVPIYGRLYNWTTAMNGSTEQGAQGIAPDGWHIPTHDEWKTLIQTLGGAAVAGGKMKEAGTTYWNAPNTGADNSSNFCGRGAGELDGFTFQFFRQACLFWTSREQGTDDAYYFALQSDTAELREIVWRKRFYYSVRCIKNQE